MSCGFPRLRPANAVAADVVNERGWRGLRTHVASPGECFRRSAAGGAVVAFNIRVVGIKLDGKENPPGLHGMPDRPIE